MLERKKKKLLIVVLTMAMLISLAPCNLVANAEESAKVTVWVAIDSLETKNSSDESLSISKTPVQLEEGSTATDAFKTVLDKNEIEYDLQNSDWGDYWASIINLGYDSKTQKYWDFAVDGESSSVGTGSYTVKEGDKLVLVYRAYGDSDYPACFTDQETEVDVDSKTEAQIQTAEKVAKIFAEYTYENTFSNGEKIPGIEDTTKLHIVSVLKKIGVGDEKFYSSVANKIIDEVSQMKDGGEVDGVTLSYYDSSYTKVTAGLSFKSLREAGMESRALACAIEALTTLGYDCTCIKGVNLVEEMVSREAYEASYYAYGAYGRDGYILKALDAGEYQVTGENAVSRDELIQAIIDDYDYAVSTVVSWGTVDSVAMDLEAVAPYYADDYSEDYSLTIDQDTIDEYVVKALNFIDTFQSADGSFQAYGASSYNSLGVCLIAIGKAGISSESLIEDEDEFDFVKNGNTVFDVAASFADLENETVANGVSYGPEQLAEGLFYAADMEFDQPELVKVAADPEVTTSEDETSSQPEETTAQTKEQTIKKVTVNKVMVKKATKKKNAARIKISLKSKVKGAKGYLVKVYKTRKNARTNKKAIASLTCKNNKKIFRVNSKKVKGLKKLFVKVKAYTMLGKKKIYSKKWSNIRKVDIMSTNN